MAMQSMTGYGRGMRRDGTRQAVVELRSVNHRFLDFSWRLPPEVRAIEPHIRRRVRDRLERGRISIQVEVSGVLPGQEMAVDGDLAAAYQQGLEQAREELGLPGSLDVATLAQLPDIFVTQTPEDQPDRIWKWLAPAVDEALEGLVTMRQREGGSLAADMERRMASVAAAAAELAEGAEEMVAAYRDRLRRRVTTLAGDAADLDSLEEALEVELAAYAERSDITEEVTRLQSHVQQWDDVVAGEGPHGRKLEFILQEIHREVNTVGAKTRDTGQGRQVVEMKSEIEKLKEQVKNLE